MMVSLKTLGSKKKLAKVELKAFKSLLDKSRTSDLSESKDILPFFDANEHLCAQMGMYHPNIVNYRDISIAREFSIFGDHKADLVIGDIKNRQFCFVEFEDAKSNSVFSKSPNRSIPEWSPRYDHGFSQLIDWILWIEHNQGTPACEERFQASSIRYNMLLVIGRDRELAEGSRRQRFEWRSEHVVFASKHVNCITFDKL